MTNSYEQQQAAFRQEALDREKEDTERRLRYEANSLGLTVPQLLATRRDAVDAEVIRTGVLPNDQLPADAPSPPVQHAEPLPPHAIPTLVDQETTRVREESDARKTMRATSASNAEERKQKKPGVIARMRNKAKKNHR